MGLTWFHSSVPRWIRDLKEGDVVCDCRGHHLRIVSIEYDVFDPVPDWMIDLPECWDWIEDAFRWFCRKLDIGLIYDLHVELSDGFNCSVRNCCSPHDHEPFAEFEYVIEDERIETEEHEQ